MWRSFSNQFFFIHVNALSPLHYYVVYVDDGGLMADRGEKNCKLSVE